MSLPSPKKNRSDTQFPGIVRHAQKLGCHRVHLYSVLKGTRSSARLISAYKALLTKEKRTIPECLVNRAA